MSACNWLSAMRGSSKTPGNTSDGIARRQLQRAGAAVEVHGAAQAFESRRPDLGGLRRLAARRSTVCRTAPSPSSSAIRVRHLPSASRIPTAVLVAHSALSSRAASDRAADGSRCRPGSARSMREPSTSNCCGRLPVGARVAVAQVERRKLRAVGQHEGDVDQAPPAARRCASSPQRLCVTRPWNELIFSGCRSFASRASTSFSARSAVAPTTSAHRTVPTRAAPRWRAAPRSAHGSTG